MSLYDDLSRLLSGDLPEDEAAALRRRIETDPEVARAWSTLSSLPEVLAELDDEAPPPELDARVLGRDAKPSMRRRWLLRVMPAALAATALLWLVLHPPEPERVALLDGSQVVHGRVVVLAGDIVVEIDGIARVSVEPDRVLARALRHEEDPMKLALSALAGAAGGAAVTVAVLEGSAVITGADGTKVEVVPGQTRTVGAPVRRTVPAPPPPGEAPAETIVRLQAEVADLSRALDEARFTGAVAQGQLTAHVGTPQPWPADVPAGLAPDVFEARVQEVLAGHEGVALAELDCSEYPCITVLRPLDGSEGWQDRVRPAAEALAEGLEGVGLSVFASNFEDDERSAAFMGVVVAPPEDSARDSDVGARMFYRADSLMEELGREALGGE